MTDDEPRPFPFCSVVVPTIGRPTLARALDSVLTQSIDPTEVEVIVVNDSGEPLHAADWQRDARVRVVTTLRRERSVARNTGAAMARGRYLAFLDDDDWLQPGALESFQSLARESPGAVWLHGGIHVVDEQGRTLGESNSGVAGDGLAEVLGGAWVPLQASLVRADAFFRAGGFDPFICGTEDLDLARRVALLGEFANTTHAVACLFRGSDWQTSTNYARAAEDTRRSRDAVLAEPGALARLVASTRSSPDRDYWFGRAARVVLSTVGYNLRQGRYSAAASRASLGLRLLFSARERVLSRRFRDALRAHHVPGTLHFISLAGERDAAGRTAAPARTPH